MATASVKHAELSPTDSPPPLFSAESPDSSLFDEWLATGLHQAGIISEKDLEIFSSPEASGTSVPPTPNIGTPAVREAPDSPDSSSKQLFDESAATSPVTPSASVDGSPWLDAAIAAFPDLAAALFKPSTIPANPATSPARSTVQLSPQAATQGTAPRKYAQLPTPPLRSISPRVTTTSTPAPLMPMPPTPNAAVPTTTGSRRGRKRTRVEETRDPSDPAFQEELALKRQKNTDAARRSRLKKLLRMEELERRVADLEGENSKLQLKVAVLESEKGSLEQRDKDHTERVKKLEEQLSEAHRALTARILAAAVPEPAPAAKQTEVKEN
ncbi:uncharacterized protein VTP21DRAFT_10784 [Calcarisporiella thermophila]|uniref:uncharacterized protein n=1 Tax=Calcarisporiella thermophila TaxID=911321 RepID=UPI00374338AB